MTAKINLVRIAAGMGKTFPGFNSLFLSGFINLNDIILDLIGEIITMSRVLSHLKAERLL